MSKESDNILFNKLKDQLSMLDPVSFCEKYLTLDGKPYKVSGNGYKPLADIMRYIGIKALEPNSLPVIICKGRQIGMTVTCAALEMYFMGSGLFGSQDRPPIRIMHLFPFLELSAAYSKTKLSQMISGSIPVETIDKKNNNKPKSYMNSLLDSSTPTNSSLQFKQFIGGNHLWIESTGLDADRIMGRQLSLDTELPTSEGFKKLIDLKEGDELFDEKGNICKITKLHPIDLKPESYKITFDDGTTVDACADHLWLTYTKQDRINLRKFKNGIIKDPPNPKIKTTKEILQTLRTKDKGHEANHSIPNTLPINYPEKDLILDPYLFGLWLGDGSNGSGLIESADPEILEGYEHHVQPSSINSKKSKSCAYRVVGLTTKLTKIGVMKATHSKIGDFSNKYIPDIYMRGSYEQRLALLQGLLDTDGHCDKNGNIEFVQVKEDLAFQVYELVLSLGIKAFIYKRDSWRYDIRNQDKYRIRFMTTLPVFKMKRKVERLKNKMTCKSSHRFIANIELIDPKPMRCITVDSPSHLYLITRKYIPTHNTSDVMIFDEVQKTSAQAMGNALKILTTAKYGKPGKGVQVFFGTPRRKGSDFYKMWMSSSQQYYYLGCENCKKHFPLYTPGSEDWKEIWIHGFIVRCPHCKHEQDKREAAERGKWIALKDHNDADCKMIGFHLNQLYMPIFTREDINNEMPGNHPINTERIFQNEVMGEFFQGDSSPITADEIREKCGEPERKFSKILTPSQDRIVVLGIDYGQKADLEQIANPENSKIAGQSYSTAVVLSAQQAGLLSIEYAMKFKKNDLEGKKQIIDYLMRQYSVQLAVGDIGYSNEISPILHTTYGDKYLVSRAHNKVNNTIKYNQEAYPKEIIFERDYYYGEMFDLMKRGQIKFPFGDYEQIAWLIEHCSSMDIKPSISKYGSDPVVHYVKGTGPNDGLAALINAYIAYKFILTKGFSTNNPNMFEKDFKDRDKPLVMTGLITRRV